MSEQGFPNPVSNEEFNHTQWAKKRALEYLDRGDLKSAIHLMLSDLREDQRRDEIQKSMIGGAGYELLTDPNLNEKMVRDFIEGFPN